MYYDNDEIALSQQFKIDLRLVDKLSRMQVKTILKTNIITPQNKINCLCFFVHNRPKIFEKLYKNNFFELDDIIKCIEFQPSCLSLFSQDIIKDINFQQKLIENVKPEWYDFLPSFISKNPEVQKKCDRTAKIYMENGLDKDGYNIDWKNENGEIICFFKLKDNFPIKSKADYYRLYSEYIKSKTSVHNFCVKYGIDSIKGFNEFLKRVEAESFEDFSVIRDVKINARNNFYIFSKETAKKIIDGKISIEEFFMDSKINFNTTKIDLYFNSLSFDEKNKLACIIMDYFEKNPYVVKENFMKFLTNNKLKPIDSYNTFVRKNLEMPKDKEYIQVFKKHISRLKAQERFYKRSDLYYTYIVNGQEYNIDDNIIDQAYAYADNNDYHISYGSMNFLCKQIVTGKLIYSKETERQKEEMISSIISLIIEEKTIEDYINAMKEKNNVKK